MPELPIISAGSLLGFALNEINFSMPVGRIEYRYLWPMSFYEFLTALDDQIILECFQKYNLKNKIAPYLFQSFQERHYQYLFTGGMPEAIDTFIKTSDFKQIRKVHQSIIETYKDDFNKYRKRFALEDLHRVFNKTLANTGQKIKYSNLLPNELSSKAKNILELFFLSKLFYRCTHSASNQLPLKAEENEKHFKIYCLDVGLLTYHLGLEWAELSNNEINSNTQAVLAEQFIAQHLLTEDSEVNLQLNYWIRENKNANAEIDFVIGDHGTVIPIEVKSGKSGTLKSLLQFCFEKKTKKGVRFYLNELSLEKVHAKIDQTKFPINLSVFQFF